MSARCQMPLPHQVSQGAQRDAPDARARARRGSPDLACARRGSPDPAEQTDRRSPKPVSLLKIQEPCGPAAVRGPETRAQREPCGPGAVRGPETRAQRARARRGSPDPAARRGATLAAVLVCVLVVMLFSAAVIRNLTIRHRAVAWEQRDLQCLYLLTSAIDRAQSRLAVDPTYTGETWNPPVASGGAGESGVAHIQVESSPELPQHYRVSIEALWPDDPVYRSRRTTELIMNRTKNGESP